MHLAYPRARSRSSARHVLRLACLLPLAALVIGCESTEPARGVTGVWSGRISYQKPSDSLTLYLEQKGSELNGWGYLRPANAPNLTYNRIVVTGTVSGGRLNLDVWMGGNSYAPFFLRGGVMPGFLESTLGIEGDTALHPAILERAPAPSELTGTWALTSTTGDQGLQLLTDTIHVSADGRARRHRQLTYAGQPYESYSVQAMLSRRGGWVVIDQSMLTLVTDSLLIGSGELTHTRTSVSGTPLIDHYTLVSRTTDMTPPPIPPFVRSPVSAAAAALHSAPAASTPAP